MANLTIGEAKELVRAHRSRNLVMLSKEDWTFMKGLLSTDQRSKLAKRGVWVTPFVLED